MVLDRSSNYCATSGAFSTNCRQHYNHIVCFQIMLDIKVPRSVMKDIVGKSHSVIKNLAKKYNVLYIIKPDKIVVDGDGNEESEVGMKSEIDNLVKINLENKGEVKKEPEELECTEIRKKISNLLEKERGHLADRLKKEQENAEKLKKSLAELKVAYASTEAAHSDLADKLQLVTKERDDLEQETARLQSQVQVNEAQRSEMSGHYKEVESQLTNMKAELEKSQVREISYQRELEELTAQLGSLETARQDGVSLKQLRTLEAKLEQEKLARQQADTQIQERMEQVKGKTKEIARLKRIQRTSADCVERSQGLQLENTILKEELYMKKIGGGVIRDRKTRRSKSSADFLLYLNSKKF